MPSTIHNFFATIDPGSPPPQKPLHYELGDSAFRQNPSHLNEIFELRASEVEAPGTAPGSARGPL
jgi:hypothetical protein